MLLHTWVLLEENPNEEESDSMLSKWVQAQCDSKLKKLNHKGW
jgi:hypothetical protein